MTFNSANATENKKLPSSRKSQINKTNSGSWELAHYDGTLILRRIYNPLTCMECTIHSECSKADMPSLTHLAWDSCIFGQLTHFRPRRNYLTHFFCAGTRNFYARFYARFLQ